MNFNMLTLAALAAAPFAAHTERPRRQARRPHQPAVRPLRLLSTPREKYPGQRRAYLAHAHRPMTDAEIREHNTRLAQRKAAA